MVAAEGEQAERPVADRRADRFGARFAEFFVGDVFEDDPVDARVARRVGRQRARRRPRDLEAVGLHQFRAAADPSAPATRTRGARSTRTVVPSASFCGRESRAARRP